MNTKPIYRVDTPDQQRLKIARIEIEAVLRKHDLAGVVVLHTPGMAEFFYDIRPTYSICWVDEEAYMVRIKSKLNQDHGGDAAEQRRDQQATANMTVALAQELWNAALLFRDVDHVVSTALRSEHTGRTFVADPAEKRRQ